MISANETMLAYISPLSKIMNIGLDDEHEPYPLGLNLGEHQGCSNVLWLFGSHFWVLAFVVATEQRWLCH